MNQTLFGTPLTDLQQRWMLISYADNLSLLFLLIAQIGLTLSMMQPYKSKEGLNFFCASLLIIAFILGIFDVLRFSKMVEFWFYVDVRRYGFRSALAIGAWGNWWINRRKVKNHIRKLENLMAREE